MPGRSYVIILALNGVSDSVVTTVNKAFDDGLAILLLTDSRKEASVRERLAPAFDSGTLRIQGARIRTMRSLRHRIVQKSLQVVRLVETFIYRVFRFAAHRLPLSEQSASNVAALGTRASAVFGRGGRLTISKALDPLVLAGGMAATKPQEVYRARRIVSELISTDLVIAVLCLDSTSLLPGWVIAKSFRGLPVLTDYPVDWSYHLVKQIEHLAGGSTS